MNEVKPSEVTYSAGVWTFTRTVFGKEISVSGPDKDQVLNEASAHLHRVLSHQNRRRS